MHELAQMECGNRIVHIVRNARYIGIHDKEDGKMDVLKDKNHDQCAMSIEFDDGSTDHFDAVGLACGLQGDCQLQALFKKLLTWWPIKVVGGFPCVPGSGMDQEKCDC